MAKDKVPGTYKSTATTEDYRRPYKATGVVENDNYRPVSNKDLALSDTRVRDEDYNYTTRNFPGRIMDDGEMKKAEGMHKKYPPLGG